MNVDPRDNDRTVKVRTETVKSIIQVKTSKKITLNCLLQ